MDISDIIKLEMGDWEKCFLVDVEGRYLIVAFRNKDYSQVNLTNADPKGAKWLAKKLTKELRKPVEYRRVSALTAIRLLVRCLESDSCEISGIIL